MKRSNHKNGWIPLLLCLCLFISFVVPFIPGVLADENETTESNRELVYTLACFTTQTSSLPPLAKDEPSVSEYLRSTVAPSVQNPTEGFVYRFPNGGGYDNFLYCACDWYYLGRGEDLRFYGIDCYPLGTPEAGYFTFNAAVVIDEAKAIPVEPYDGQNTKTVEIEWENRVNDSLLLEQNEKQTVRAVLNDMYALSYQWQILLDLETDIWVNIVDKTEADCEVSYALVQNMLDEADGAFLRCAVTDAVETVYSAPICVVVKPTPVFDDWTEASAAADAAAPEAELTRSVATRALSKAVGPTPISVTETPPQGAGESDVYITITVNYLRKITVDGEEAIVTVYDPYTATILQNSAFAQNVVSPSFMGFAPYYDADQDGEIDDDASTLHLNYSEAQTGSNIVINVYYLPIPVPFAIKFFFQNVNDDLYTEDTGLYTSSSALTGTPVTSDFLAGLANANTTGFSNLYHVPEEIAADGSTVFEVYYDRNYYLIQFDLAGGYGVEPVYGRYDADFVVNNPKKAGYVFAGWKLIYIDENDDHSWDDETEAIDEENPPAGVDVNELVSKIPAHSYYYRATWRTVTTSYTTVYWLKHNDGTRSYLGSKVDYKQSGDTASGSNDLYSSYICGEHTHTLACFTSSASLPPLADDSDGYYVTLRDSVPFPVEGYVYRARFANESVYRNYLYCGGNWYNLGTGAGTSLYGIGMSSDTPEEGYYITLEATRVKCLQEGHEHSAEDGCFDNCTHSTCWYCYSNNDPTYANDVSDSTMNSSYPYYTYYYGTAFTNLKNELQSAGISPSNGDVYHYSYVYRSKQNWISSWTNINTYYNYAYINGEWYYLGMDSSYNGITFSTNPSQITTNAYRTSATLQYPTHHRHTAECLSCTKVHTHTDACTFTDTRHYEYVYPKNHYANPDPDDDYFTEENVTVNGDGSTVVNVYYKPKVYTLRFYYAATINSEAKVIGGSTYAFGNGDVANGLQPVNTADDATLLNHVFSRGGVGTVTAIPQLNALGLSRNYATGTLQSGSNSYHYIEFTAEYGQDISKLWPCAVFDSATRAEPFSNSNGWTKKKAYVSAWNGEHHVYYSQHNTNQTIKGNYQVLDEKLLFDSQFDDELTVSYLCFWENGAGDISWNNPNLFVYNIWVPVLSGEETTLPTKTFNGVLYKQKESYPTCDNNAENYEEQTQPSLIGFKALTYEGSGIDDSIKDTYGEYKQGFKVDFYYTRNSYNFTMMNLGHHVEGIQYPDSGNTLVPYETRLSSLFTEDTHLDPENGYAPDYPDTLEQGAYAFEGWYTTAQFAEDTRVNLTTLSMPASGLILYAHWVKVDHTVNFFKTYEELTAYGNGDAGVTLYGTRSVPHGDVYGTILDPQIADMRFVGWFYIENGQKKAFTPLNMPVNHDLNVFADWTSFTPQPFRVSYVLKGTTTKIADDTLGRAYAGSTRTFNAAVGAPYNQLYSDLDGVNYNEGYFPTVSSHSITMRQEADEENPTQNVYSFEYVSVPEISYTVRYLDRDTKLPLAEEDTGTSTSAVITVPFKQIDNYLPDSFHKRLILEVREDELNPGSYIGTENNVITFYYTYNETNAFYSVHVMLEKPGDHDASNFDIHGNGGYAESGVGIEGIGEIGQNVLITPQSVAGFDYVPLLAQARVYQGEDDSGAASYNAGTEQFTLPVSAEGSELYIFYRRNSYNYRVHYYDYNTTTSRHADTTGSALYGTTVTLNHLEIDGYTCVNPASRELTIHDSEAANTIIYYYRPNEYIVDYVAVTADEGMLSLPREVVTGSTDLTGSIPTAKPNCEFVGWFTDEACTVPVPAAAGTVNSTTKLLTPNKNSLSRNEAGSFYGKFYAKFIKLVGDLTIERTDAAESDQVFVYEVRSVEDSDYVIYVTVTGNGSVTVKDLPLGNYTVTEQNAWAWRYDGAAETVEHNNAETTVSFSVTNSPKTSTQWLKGNSAVVTNQRGS